MGGLWNGCTEFKILNIGSKFHCQFSDFDHKLDTKLFLLLNNVDLHFQNILNIYFNHKNKNKIQIMQKCKNFKIVPPMLLRSPTLAIATGENFL